MSTNNVLANESFSASNGINNTDDFFHLDLSVDENQSDFAKNEKKPWSLYGSVDFKSQYATKNQLNDFAFRREGSGLSQSRATVRVNFLSQLFDRIDLDIRTVGFYDNFYHQNRNDFSDQEFSALADEFEIRDAHIQFETWDNLWFKFGRQVIAFGESDFTQIVDVINPRDEREFGLVDLEDARLPIMASRLSYVGQRWGLDVVLTHEFESHRDAGEGADFDRYITLRNSISIDQNREPNLGLSNMGKVVRGFWSHARGDITLILAKSVDQSPILALSPLGNRVVDEVYPEVTTYGISANWVDGSWLLKGELARKDNTFIARNDLDEQLTLGFGQGELFIEKDIVQSLVGFEYSAYQDIQLASEITTTTILDHEDKLAAQKSESVISSRIAFEFLRDTAELEVLWSHWLDNNSDSVRLAYRYDYTDHIQWSLGYIDFLSDDINGTLYPYRNNDRVFGSLTYSF